MLITTFSRLKDRRLVVDDQDVSCHLFGDFAASDKAKPLLFHIAVAKAVGLTLDRRSATALAAN